MKRALVVALVGLNAALLLALIFGPAAPKANAQGIIGASTDYLVLTGNIGRDYDAVYVIDVKRQGMIAFRFDKTKKRLIPYRGVRRLKTDFRKKR